MNRGLRIELSDPSRPDEQRGTAEMQTWQIYMGMVASVVHLRSYIAAHALASMIANPDYHP